MIAQANNQTVFLSLTVSWHSSAKLDKLAEYSLSSCRRENSGESILCTAGVVANNMCSDREREREVGGEREGERERERWRETDRQKERERELQRKKE